MSDKKLYWKLFAQCKIVKGASKIIICDLQRNDYYYINQGIYEILTTYSHLSISEVKDIYDENINDHIEKNFKYLIENELVFITENPNWFPEIKVEWQNPHIITNGIIELSPKNNYLPLILNELETLGCLFIELRIKEAIDFKELEEIVIAFSNSKIRNINLNIKYDFEVEHESYKKLVRKFQRIGTINIFGAPISVVDDESYALPVNIIYYYQSIDYTKACGKIDEQFFVSGIEMFMESNFHNSCLNRKISIDTEGNIKNCPSMIESFGNVQDTTLKEAIEKPGFKKYWDTNKDKIDICKDCEFRYICTDCRAFVEDPEDDLSKPLKCGYNPYTGEWNEWSSNPLKQKAIEYYDLMNLAAEVS